MTDQEIEAAAKLADGKRIPVLIFPNAVMFERAKQLKLVSVHSPDYETSNARGRASAARTRELGLVETFEIEADEELLQGLATQRV